MPFNSTTYYMNKYRRQALASLAKAREATEPFWRNSGARQARNYWRLYLSHRRLKRMNEDSKRMWKGEMTAVAFMEKWKLPT